MRQIPVTLIQSLRKRRLNRRLIELMTSHDLQLWPSLREQLSREDLLEPIEGDNCALALCVLQGHHTLLEQLLLRFPELIQIQFAGGESLLERVLQSDQRLALLSAMLSTGLNPNTEVLGEPLVLRVLEQPPENAMLLINRLAQHGATLNDPRLLSGALRKGNLALIKFLADSGAPLEITQTEDLDPEMLAFARRAIDDKRIRDLWA